MFHETTGYGMPPPLKIKKKWLWIFIILYVVLLGAIVVIKYVL